MIRLAKPEDLPRLLEVYAAARAYMCQTGNPTQWADGYPKERLLAEDIRLQRLYCLEDAGGRICACFMLAPGPDATYARIHGAWDADLPYGVLHRVASDGSCRRVVAQCVAFAAGRFDYLRIDTHENNLPMQQALSREGFAYRGIITTHDGTPRLAYDRMGG